MLKLWTYQALRLDSHSGTCWTTAISATSGAGRSRTAGMRKTFVGRHPPFAVRDARARVRRTEPGQLGSGQRPRRRREVWIGQDRRLVRGVEGIGAGRRARVAFGRVRPARVLERAVRPARIRPA